MPENTPRLGIPKPLGTENVNRIISFNNIWDLLDQKVALDSDLKNLKTTVDNLDATILPENFATPAKAGKDYPFGITVSMISGTNATAFKNMIPNVVGTPYMVITTHVQKGSNLMHLAEQRIITAVDMDESSPTDGLEYVRFYSDFFEGTGPWSAIRYRTPLASLTQVGMSQLSSLISNDENKAATPKSVKTAYDAATAANTAAANAQQTANAAKSTAEAALPKSGGTITGSLAVGGTQLKVRYTGASNITVPIGDSDTGFNWAGDGALEIWSNNVVIAKAEGGLLKLRGDDGTYRGVNELNRVAVASVNVRHSDSTQRSYEPNGSVGLIFYKFIAPAPGEYFVEGTLYSNPRTYSHSIWLSGYSGSYKLSDSSSGMSANPAMTFNWTTPVGSVVSPPTDRGFTITGNMGIPYGVNEGGDKYFGFTTRVASPGPVYLIVCDPVASDTRTVSVRNVTVKYDLVNV